MARTTRKPKRIAAKKIIPRMPKRVSIAAAIETLFNDHENDYLDSDMEERAQLISDILFDVGNESEVRATHSRLVKAYVLTLWDVLPTLTGRDHEAVQIALQHVTELIDGCSEARYDRISKYHSLDYKQAQEAQEARRVEHGDLEPKAAPAAPKQEQEESEAETFDLRSLLADVREVAFVHLTNSSEPDFEAGDLLLIDRSRTTPRDGEYVAWDKGTDTFTVGVFREDTEHEGTLFGTAITLIRRFTADNPPRADDNSAEISKLRSQLDRLENVPENEAVAFQLRTQIHQLEIEAETTAQDEEWPDVIGGHDAYTSA